MRMHTTFAVHHLAISAAPCCRDDLFSCLAAVACIIRRPCLAWVACITLNAATWFIRFDNVFHLVHFEIVRQPGDVILWNRCLLPARWTTQIARPPAVVVHILKTFLAECVKATEHLRDCEWFHTYRTLE